MVSDSKFDLIVLGAGPAGEVVASRLAARGLSPALVESELVGGECAYWACIPSKTLLRAPEVVGEARRAAGVSEPETRFSDIAEYRDYMVRNLDDRDEVRRYEEGGTTVFKGRGTIRGPGEVEVSGNVLHSERIVIATGSRPIDPLDPGSGGNRLLDEPPGDHAHRGPRVGDRPRRGPGRDRAGPAPARIRLPRDPGRGVRPAAGPRGTAGQRTDRGGAARGRNRGPRRRRGRHRLRGTGARGRSARTASRSRRSS